MSNVRNFVKIFLPAAIILITTSFIRHTEERRGGDGDPPPPHSPAPDKVIQIKELFLLLTELALQPPEAPVNQTCKPPELREEIFPHPPSIEYKIVERMSFREPTCATETGFTGRRRSKKASIILMMLFSFEVDTLEISLREIQDVVDHIFIVESSTTHRGVF